MSTWKPIPGLEDYEASDQGHIAWNSPHGRKMLRPGTNTSGHQTVGIRKDGKTQKRYIHELVLLAHIGQRPTGHVACHQDDNPSNNTLTNLRWDTRRNNLLDAIRNGRYNALIES